MRMSASHRNDPNSILTPCPPAVFFLPSNTWPATPPVTSSPRFETDDMMGVRPVPCTARTGTSSRAKIKIREWMPYCRFWRMASAILRAECARKRCRPYPGSVASCRPSGGHWPPPGTRVLTTDCASRHLHIPPSSSPRGCLPEGCLSPCPCR